MGIFYSYDDLIINFKGKGSKVSWRYSEMYFSEVKRYYATDVQVIFFFCYDDNLLKSSYL